MSPRASLLSEGLTRITADVDQTRALHDLLGGYCHDCRNHLNSLKMSLYLMRRYGLDAPTVDELDAEYEVLERFVDLLQTALRPLSLTFVTLPIHLLLDDRARHWQPRWTQTGRRLTITRPDPPLSVTFDLTHLGRCLDEILRWRLEAGPETSELRLHCRRDGSFIEFVWTESPSDSGLPHPQPPPGLPSSVSSPHSLIHPLVARIMTLHQGSARLAVDGLWSLTMRWPAVLDLPTREASRC